MTLDESPPGPESPAHLAASRRILSGLLLTMFVSGVVGGLAEERAMPEPLWWTIMSAFLSSFLTFCWFRRDRDARGIRRSVWATSAILLLEPVAMVVYILVSRPRGHKLRGFGRLAGFSLLMVLAVVLGMLAAFAVA